MNNHYDPSLVIKYLKLDSQFPEESGDILARPSLFKVDPSNIKSDDSEGGGSGVFRSQVVDSCLKAKFNLLKKTEAIARLETHLVERSDEKIREYQRAAEFYTPYIEDHWELMRLYSTMRGRFRDDLINLSEQERNSPVFLQRVADLLILGSILKGVHRHGLNVPSMTRMYLRDQKLLVSYIEQVAGLSVDLEPWEPEPTLDYGTKTVRDFHLQWNLFRLFWVRSRRFIGLLALYWQGDFLQGFRTAELNGTLFFFSYLAFLFFLPRLLVNLGLIYKHVFDESSMTEVERHLGWKVRLRAQLVRRWQELVNDIAWLSSGITTCFFLANQLPAVGLYLALAMQSYDLCVTTNRCFIEYRRLRKLKKDLLAVDDDQNPSQLLADIDKRILFDLIELAYAWVNFLLLLACALLMTPFFAGLNPLVPIIAAVVAIAVTLLTYCVTRYLSARRATLYDGALVAPTIRCVKEMNEKDSKISAQNIDTTKIDLGIFAIGFLRIVDNQDHLVNVLYVNKQTGQTVNFLKGFCWDKSRTLSRLQPEDIKEIKKLFDKIEEPISQKIRQKIEQAEEPVKLLFSVEETRYIIQHCKVFSFHDKFDTNPAYKISDLEIYLPKNKSKETQLMIKAQQEKMMKALVQMEHDVTKLTNAEKMPFWQDFSKQTSKSVYAFSGAILGVGG